MGRESSTWCSYGSCGYPIKYTKGDKISGLNSIDKDNAKVFHAGTILKENEILTAGGRVLCVVGMGNDIHNAQKNSYENVTKISWKDEYHRNDIGSKAIDRS